MAYNRPNGDTRFNELSIQKQPVPSVEMDNEWTGLKNAVNEKLARDGAENFTGVLTLEKALQFLESGDEYIRLPRLTTAQRDALAAVDAMLIFNTDTIQIEVYINGAWSAVVDADTIQTIDGKALKGYTAADRDLLEPIKQQLLYNLDTSLPEICSVAAGGAGYAAWVATQAYILTDGVTPVTPPDGLYWYECTTAGTAGTVEPTWPTTVGATVADGTVIWTTRLQAQWKALIDETAGAKLTGLANGGYVTKSWGTIYQATTDLFVMFWADNTVSVRNIYIETGPTAGLGTILARDSADTGYASVFGIIPSGNYYRLTTTNGSGGHTMLVMALGG